MPFYKVNVMDGLAQPLNRYKFYKEGGDIISPQKLIVNNPSIILDIPDIEIQSGEKVLVAEEYNTSRGPIDVLIITSNADIIIVETKLFKNPEAHRTVVAQAIDYTKAFYAERLNALFSKLSGNKTMNQKALSDLRNDDFWTATLDKNIKSGNFQVVIVGDKIHPNVLGMVESIQSAPHMSFTIFLVSLDTVQLDENSLVISPTMAANTIEIERSVIRIEIDHDKKEHVIESEVPEKEGKGTKPILSPNQYLDSLSKQEFRPLIERGWDKWKRIGGDIRFGTVGFSMGVTIDSKRLPIFFVYNNRLATLSEKTRLSLNISDELYQQYKEDLKDSQFIYDGYCIGNKVEVPYSEISKEDLEIVLSAAINLGQNVLKEDSD